MCRSQVVGIRDSGILLNAAPNPLLKVSNVGVDTCSDTVAANSIAERNDSVDQIEFWLSVFVIVARRVSLEQRASGVTWTTRERIL